MKKTKHLTKRERKSLERGATGPTPRAPARAAPTHHHDHARHIHCIACGKHLDPSVFGEPEGAEFIRCEHGSDFPCCVACHDRAQELVAAHDRDNQPVKTAGAWH